MATKKSKEEERLTLADVVDKAIREKGFFSRKYYLNDAEGRGILHSSQIVDDWIRNPSRFKLFYLHKIVEDIQIPQEHIDIVYGSDPFEPPIEEIKRADNPLGALFDWYINFRTGQRRLIYLRKKEALFIHNILLVEKFFFGEDMPLFYINLFSEDLNVSRDYLAQICGKDPLMAPIDEFLSMTNPVGTLIDWYINLRTGKSRRAYLKQKERGIIENWETTSTWIHGTYHFPLSYLHRIVDDLKIPRSELTKVCGKDPFIPPIDDFRKSNQPLAMLIDWYIEFRYGIKRITFLKQKENVLTRFPTVNTWFNGKADFPLFYLNKIIQDLNIPRSELTKVCGKDPFTPPLQEFKIGENPIGLLLDWYIGLRTGKSRQVYLKDNELQLKRRFDTPNGWFKGAIPFPLWHLDYFCKDLNVPREDLIEVVGRDPLNPPLDEFGESKNAVGKLLDWYIDLRTGKQRKVYLSQYKGGLFKITEVGDSWFNGRKPFPPQHLKTIVDDLKIPYDQVNQFIDYDISDTFEVSIRSRNVTTQHLIQSALESLQIPTDPHSLYQLVTTFGENLDLGISELVDLMYSAHPVQIAALERKKIGRQEMKNYLRQYLESESGKGSGRAGSGNLPPFLTISRVVPFESYQKEAAVRNHLLDMSLRAHMTMPYETAMQRINSQLAANPADKVLQSVLSETRDYLEKMNGMPGRVTKVGN